MRGLMIVAAAALVVVGAAPASADTRAGYDLWNAGDYYGAVREWRAAAIAGDADAQYNLGQAYKLGRGVPVDLKMAESWYGKAAQQGNVAARDNYGLMLFQNGDRQAALPYIEEAAGRGEPRAQYVLGTALFNGDMVKKDWVRAYALMTRSSAAGIAAASTSLAQMDKYIPLDQRQRGLALARTFEDAATRPRYAELDVAQGSGSPASGVRGSGRAAIGTETMPPSRVADEAGAPPVDARPAPVARPVRVRPMPTPRPRPVPVERDVEQIVERPVTPPRPAAGATWRVQLGAFADAGKVQSAWTAMRARIGALSPYTLHAVTAGPVTRLQVGPLPSRVAADRLCAAVKAAGQACLPVAP